MAVTGVSCTPEAARNLLAEDLLSEDHLAELTFDDEAIRVQSRICGLHAVVVFDDARRLESSRMVRRQLKKFPYMRPLIVFLKQFFHQRSLLEAPEGLGSHLLVVLVSLFLQSLPHEQNDDTGSCAGMSLGQFLIELFRHYGKEFEYDIQALSAGGCKVICELPGSNVEPSRHRVDADADRDVSTFLYVASAGRHKLCLNVSEVQKLFAHGFHCLCDLLRRSSPDSPAVSPVVGR